ncbi:hypothetical protein P152DRAFT_455982 [Eremomyces bilateralis CBS 781.70]|uniref:Uncharacterized protein n=1 Tax=Eremomyces bilateralis CBS 781.70 TaxID=1392243 RepID=A0A6G1GA34_9PEZI|nr:uncharacterized protein P152DRAFT_455982 [Eremomyces bilateralis CBS 781.70]KAF1814938.1 hypothetical protein P152DRAFT_455982 [Eremomyces bilateralis CBS 781.70]
MSKAPSSNISSWLIILVELTTVYEFPFSQMTFPNQNFVRTGWSLGIIIRSSVSSLKILIMKIHFLLALIAALGCDGRRPDTETHIRPDLFEAGDSSDRRVVFRTRDTSGQRSSHLMPKSSPDNSLEGSPTLEEITDHLIFDTSLMAFLRARRHQEPAELVWTSDGCSGVPNWIQNKPGFPFVPACLRHDFGYRNYMDQDRLTLELVHAIAEKFEEDLMALCGWQHSMAIRTCTMIVKRMVPIARHHSEYVSDPLRFCSGPLGF